VQKGIWYKGKADTTLTVIRGMLISLIRPLSPQVYKTLKSGYQSVLHGDSCVNNP